MKLNWKLEARRNSAVIAVITLLLVVAVYLNWSYGREQDDVTQLSPLSDVVLDESKDEQNNSATPTLDDNNDSKEDGTPASTVNGVSDAERFSEKQWQIAVNGKDGSMNTVVSGESTGKVVSLEEYFSEARLNRQQSKDEAMTILQTTLSDENSSADAKTNAEETMASLASNAICESRIESLVIAKGFSDCVAVVDGNAVSVVVQAPQDGLASEDVAKIKDIVLSETNITAEQIRIIEAG